VVKGLELGEERVKYGRWRLTSYKTVVNWDMFKCSGTIQVIDGVRIITDLDLIRYYHWLVTEHFYNCQRFQLPTHGAHVTVINPKLHKVNWSKARKYIGKVVEFEVFPEDAYVSAVNVWIPVKCAFADGIKKELGVDDGPKYWGMHATVCNRKFNG